MDFSDILLFLKERDLTMIQYERKAYDAFLKDVGFSAAFPFVHIAGSNGKSSVANYLANIYRLAGYKVASFIKPFSHSPLEMTRINGEMMKEGDFARIFSKFEGKIKGYALTSFEIETFVSLVYFGERGVDLAIVECGMGGEKDATNILEATPMLSIITSVSLEHTKFLGDSIKEIAKHKAAIIKRNSKALIGNLSIDAKKMVAQRAAQAGSELFEIKDISNAKYEAPYYHFDYEPYKDLMIVSPAYYEVMDASIALEAIKILRLSYPVSFDAIQRGLMDRQLECRLERVKNVYIDGAHNPEAIEKTMESAASIFMGRKAHVLFSSFKDKDVMKNIGIIKRYIDDVTLTTFDSKRARGIADYPESIRNSFPFNSSYELAINFLLATYPNDPILVIGSLEFAYRMRDYLKNVLKYG